MRPSFYTFTIAPLTVLPFQKTLFSYAYHKKLPRGSLVTIPLSGRTITGVVLEMAPHAHTVAPAWLKNIISAEKRPPLTPEQLVLAEAVSRITFTPLGRVLRHFVPKQAKTKRSPSAQKTFLPPQQAVPEIAQALELLKKESHIFLPLGLSESHLETLFFLVHQLKEKKGQILILAPDIAACVRLEKAWEKYTKEEEMVSLYHTKAAGPYFEAWNRIQEGKAKIIIATRHGLFAPFQKLSAILQIDPAEESYKQWDMSPRYHAESVIPLLQNIWAAKVIEIATIPPLSVLFKNIPSLPLSSFSVQPEWVNLKTERYQKNWGVFAESLQTALRETLAKNEQALLYVHQSGIESFSVCTECRTIFRCPSCHSALKLTASDHYRCKHCGFQSSLFPQCPSCKNIHFKSVGYGTEKVAKAAAKLFPQANIVIADKPHLNDHKKLSAFLEKSTTNEPDILIATSSHLRFPPLSRLAVIAIIDADTLLNLPGFRKDEQFVELLEKAKSLLSPGGRLFVQTYQPHRDLFQKIATESTEKILQDLLEERSLLCYPPVYRALTLEARPKQKEGQVLLKSATKKLKELISRHPKKKELKKSILVQTATRRERGKDIPYTLIRYQPPLHPEVIDFLTREADTIFIDHDPLHIT